MEINEHIIQLRGSASIPEALTIGNNYKIIADGSITDESLKDNHDGTFNKKFFFQPVLVEIVDDKGKSIKAQDTRSDSKLWKGILWAKWKQDDRGLNDDEFYHKVNAWLRRNADYVVIQAFLDE